MTVIQIPTEQIVFYKTSIVLSGQVYELTFRWSTRSLPSWYMDIGTTLLGVKVVNGIDLLGPYHYKDDVPRGLLVAKRNSGTSSKPVYDNFGIGKEITLVYED
jgi:hypothetical protein